MNYITHLNAFFDRVSGDGRLTAYHISLYLAVFQLWNLNRFAETFPVSRAELMILSRLRSVNTYARCMKELDQWGYIRYVPSANCHSASEVTGIRFDTGNNTGNNTGNHTRDSTGDRTGDRTGHRTGDDTLIKRINRKTGNKSPHQIFENGRKRKINGPGPYHVSTDKDYSEPL